MDALVRSGANVPAWLEARLSGDAVRYVDGVKPPMKRVFYNSCGDAALYALIREAAAGRCELVALDARRRRRAHREAAPKPTPRSSPRTAYTAS